MNQDLPDLFSFADGRRVSGADDWQQRRAELLDLILAIEYGRLPPVPATVRGEVLHFTTEHRCNNARNIHYRLVTGPDPVFQFTLNLLIPGGRGPFPVVLTGDGCWRFLTDEITMDILARGYIVAGFNRVTIVPDAYTSDRVTGLYRAAPHGDYGALAAWAWGYHRCVDFLVTLPDVDRDRIAITGHSRGGKAVLLAGATDGRIALTAPNNSGCGGAGCFRITGAGSETLSDILKPVPYWFGPRLKEFIGREADLPFDQHSVKALVAPRALVSTEALGDLWSNPSGTWRTHAAARDVYSMLGAAERIGIWYREGDHDHGREDWAAFLDFADWHFKGLRPSRRFDVNPYA